jgi:hypothetical protein
MQLTAQRALGFCRNASCLIGALRRFNRWHVGPTTRDAVAKVQIANELNVTGSLSPDTLQSLGLQQATAS